MKKDAKKNKRAAKVFIGLVGALTLTAGLLLAVSPAPLKPDGTSMLALEGVSDAAGKPAGSPAGNIIPPGRWQYIYLHHSKASTASGDADHFIVTTDGRVVQTARWKRQLSAAPPVPGARMNATCVSIQLVGDLDQQPPTPAQMVATQQLVSGLQQQYTIPARSVILTEQRRSAASHGQHFPVAAFQAGLAQ